MDEELKGLIERGVAAVERLADDPVIQVETKPPVCPHCERMNPMVKVHERETEGKLAEFVILAECQNCHKSFFGMPFQWEVAVNKEEAQQIISERAELTGYGISQRENN